MPTPFVHLRMHSEYSVKDSLVRMDQVVKIPTADGKWEKKHVCPPVERAKTFNMPALALSDTNNLFGLVKFYKAARDAGIQAIPAVDLTVRREPAGPLFKVLVIAQNREGYGELCEMLSAAYKKNPDPKKSDVFVDFDWFKVFNKNLIVLSGAMDGDVGMALQEGKVEDAERIAKEWNDLFPGRYYVELQRYGRPFETDYIESAVALADRMDLPIVATHPIQYMDPTDHPYHEIRTSIADKRLLSDPARPHVYTPQQYFVSPEEMQERFKDLPDALQNSVEIAKRCHFEIELGKPQLPNFPIPEGMTISDYMRKVAFDGLEKRLHYLYEDPAIVESKRKEYEDRLDFELNTIVQMGFEGYFLIVADFINWAKENNVPVGPGRGSGAGSLVAYSLGITDLDPLEYDLLFERFLNPERVSMPDFDVDFCEKTRYKVIQYVSEKYGSSAVSQIATFGTGAAKGVIRDSGRVQSFSYGFVDNLSKMIPGGPDVHLKDALEANPDLPLLLTEDEEVKKIWTVAERLEGIVRNVGKHAGGVLIAPGKITDFCPLYAQEEGSFVSQYDKDDVEAIGLVKFDFLGLKTLTIIQRAIDSIAAQGKAKLDPNRFDLEDGPVWDLLKAAETVGVFQVESKGMKGLLSKMQPDNFEDLIALVALFRPGPLQSGMVDDFINRKHGKANVDYMANLLDMVKSSVYDAESNYEGEKKSWSDAQWNTWKQEQKEKIVSLLEPILSPTYGVIVYQEQVMQIAQAISGYTLGGADMLRRAMGKKKPEEMAKQRDTFVNGAIKNGVDGDFSGKLFDLIAMFAEYGFNKSHSAAYALVTYQTAWLKHHYPVEFMASAMTAEMNRTEQLGIYIDDAKRMGLKIHGVDINRSQVHFHPLSDGSIQYGMGAVKNVGDTALLSIMEARKDGPFESIEDFLKRVNRRTVNKKVLERLVAAGAFDSMDPNRAKLMDGIPRLMTYLDEVEDAKQKALAPKKVKKAPAPKKKTKKELAAEASADMFAAPAPDPVPEVPAEPELSDEEKIAQAIASVERPTFWNEDVKPWDLRTMLEKEKESLDIHFSHHPFEIYAKDVKSMTRMELGHIKPCDVSVNLCGVVSSIFTKPDKEGREMAFIQLDDGVDKAELLFFHDSYAGNKNAIQLGEFLMVEAQIKKNEKYDRPSVIAQAAYSFAETQKKFGNSNGEFGYDGALPSGMESETSLEDMLLNIPTSDMTADPENDSSYMPENDEPMFS